MREESRDEEAQDEVVATTAVEEEDAAQYTLIKASIRAKVRVVPTSSLICPAIVETLGKLVTEKPLGLEALGGSVRFDNGMEFGTEEALLILLYKFTSPTRNIQLVEMFGRDHTFIEYSIG